MGSVSMQWELVLAPVRTSGRSADLKTRLSGN